jgi:hypothetical protein
VWQFRLHPQRGLLTRQMPLPHRLRGHLLRGRDLHGRRELRPGAGMLPGGNMSLPPHERSATDVMVDHSLEGSLLHACSRMRTHAVHLQVCHWSGQCLSPADAAALQFQSEDLAATAHDLSPGEGLSGLSGHGRIIVIVAMGVMLVIIAAVCAWLLMRKSHKRPSRHAIAQSSTARGGLPSHFSSLTSSRPPSLTSPSLSPRSLSREPSPRLGSRHGSDKGSRRGTDKPKRPPPKAPAEV